MNHCWSWLFFFPPKISLTSLWNAVAQKEQNQVVFNPSPTWRTTHTTPMQAQPREWSATCGWDNPASTRGSGAGLLDEAGPVRSPLAQSRISPPHLPNAFADSSLPLAQPHHFPLLSDAVSSTLASQVARPLPRGGHANTSGHPDTRTVRTELLSSGFGYSGPSVLPAFG